MKSFRLILASITFLLITLIFETTFAHNWMAPEDEAKRKNPIPIALESIQKGKEIYNAHCSYCHGEKSTGLKKEETGLSINTPNLVKRIKNHTDGDFHWKIKTGKDDMPSFKDELSDTDIWHVINYLKNINK